MPNLSDITDEVSVLLAADFAETMRYDAGQEFAAAFVLGVDRLLPDAPSGVDQHNRATLYILEGALTLVKDHTVTRVKDGSMWTVEECHPGQFGMVTVDLVNTRRLTVGRM